MIGRTPVNEKDAGFRVRTAHLADLFTAQYAIAVMIGRTPVNEKDAGFRVLTALHLNNEI